MVTLNVNGFNSPVKNYRTVDRVNNDDDDDDIIIIIIIITAQPVVSEKYSPPGKDSHRLRVKVWINL